ncbi:MAG TPA: hypothetical protein VHA76_05690 [Solirubrobacterales bacterium]|nr:hypothetical protein [Solirubrobacterales bacterium]
MIRRRLLLILISSWALFGVASVTGPIDALATTGPTPLAHPPRFNVTRSQAAPYLGRFKLAPPLGRELISGAYVAGYNERGFVEGTMEIYRYDAAGRPAVLLGRTYEYHAIGGAMVIDLISPENQVILGRLKLRPAAGGRLTGTVRSLLPPRPPRRITLAPVARVADEGAAEPGAAGSPAPSPAEGGGEGAASTAAIVTIVRQLFGVF